MILLKRLNELGKSFPTNLPSIVTKKGAPSAGAGGSGGRSPLDSPLLWIFMFVWQKKQICCAFSFLLWCFLLLLLLLHKRALGKKQLMVNLVFQRGQDVTRLQTAIFCVVPVLVQKVEYLFSSLLAGNEKNFLLLILFLLPLRKKAREKGAKKRLPIFLWLTRDYLLLTCFCLELANKQLVVDTTLTTQRKIFKKPQGNIDSFQR